MTHEEKRQFFQCLFAIAWVDGSIGKMENAILATLFNNVELSPEIREEVHEWFDAAPPDPDWEAAGSNAETRDLLLRQVYLVAAADGNVDASEFSMLQGLREKLNVDDDAFNAMAQEIEKIVGS